MKKVFIVVTFFYITASNRALAFIIPPKAAATFSNLVFFSNATDHFRSVQSGDWSSLSTWQSSPDLVTWAAATLIPDNLANTISIRNGHTVTVSTSQSMDQVTIDNGGILLYSGGMLTVNDGAGDDITVQNGGVFTLAVNATPPDFLATATANILTGGILRVSATGITFAGTGVHANNFIYQHASVLEYTPTMPFATSGVTYFPNVNALTIPIFRTTGNIGFAGAIANTLINGVFEANGNITFDNSGTKTFRNGITGTGNVNGSTSGKFIINGSTAILGGTGLLTLPTADGMDIGASTTISMVSSKTVIGNINLLANALVMLGSHSLTHTATINGVTTTSHIVTNGTGKLVKTNAGSSFTIYPVGPDATTLNSIAISNGSGYDYGVRVELGINPTIDAPLDAVNRTWFVTPFGGNPAAVNVNFRYEAAHCNAGWTPPPAQLELGLYTGVWNVVQVNLTQAGTNPYQVPTVVPNFGDGIEAPLVLANIGAILAVSNGISVNYFNGNKQNGIHVLNWKLSCNSTSAVNMVMERSTDGINYRGIYMEVAAALRCELPFSFMDINPAAGVNYYHIKITGDAGKINYSPVVRLINAASGIEVMDITPNPVINGSFNLKISAAAKMDVQLVISDMQGRILQKQTAGLISGFNSIAVNAKAIAKGTYHISVYASEFNTMPVRFVVQ
ncbi:MAG: T9SS type A sorting domain-containing protein [Chitinophagaceae bacterium]|nr:T9SS type A sorting domain-containing protein [Chitinophagaceae bacterium]